MLSDMEARNEEGHQNYRELELLKKMQAGEEARQELARLQEVSGRNYQSSSLPEQVPLPQAGPSSTQTQVPSPIMHSVVVQEREPPLRSFATIEEVISPPRSRSSSHTTVVPNDANATAERVGTMLPSNATASDHQFSRLGAGQSTMTNGGTQSTQYTGTRLWYPTSGPDSLGNHPRLMCPVNSTPQSLSAGSVPTGVFPYNNHRSNKLNSTPGSHVPSFQPSLPQAYTAPISQQYISSGPDRNSHSDVAVRNLMQQLKPDQFLSNIVNKAQANFSEEHTKQKPSNPNPASHLPLAAPAFIPLSSKPVRLSQYSTDGPSLPLQLQDSRATQPLLPTSSTSMTSENQGTPNPHLPPVVPGAQSGLQISVVAPNNPTFTSTFTGVRLAESAATQKFASDFSPSTGGSVFLQNIPVDLGQPRQTYEMTIQRQDRQDRQLERRHQFLQNTAQDHSRTINMTDPPARSPVVWRTYLPSTPPPPQTHTIAKPSTPASADKKRLARDIMRSLGRPVQKRPRLDLTEPAQSSQITDPFLSTSLSGSIVISDEQRNKPQPDIIVIEDGNGSEHLSSNAKPGSLSLHNTRVAGAEFATETSVPDSLQRAESRISPSDNERIIADVEPPFTSGLLRSSPLSPSFEITPDESFVAAHPYSPGRIVGSSKVPLFLPSPTSSPEATDFHGEVNAATVVRLDIASIEAPLKAAHARSQSMKEVYVLPPPLPLWARKLKAKDQGELDEMEEMNEELRRQQEVAEGETVIDSRFRLHPRYCRWRGCSALLNSTDRLKSHARVHVDEMDGVSPYICQWKNCVRRFSDQIHLKHHVESHTQRPLHCAFMGCEEHFQHAHELVVHNKREHHSGALKPTVAPSRRSALIHLPPLPDAVPSYMSVSRPIYQTPISTERHAKIGPWVLRNIFAPINFDLPKYNAARPLRMSLRNPKEEPSGVYITRHDQFDFLATMSQGKKPRSFSDIPSHEVTEACRNGLTLWKEVVEEAPSDPPDDELVEGRPGL